MVGPHGAGLMHNIFMRDRAVLVELHIDGSNTNRHFHNLARWSGHGYISPNVNNPIDSNNLKNVIATIISGMDLSKY